MLDATLRSPDAENPSVLEAVLEVADSTITFRSRYNLLPHLPAVFDLVLLDDKNPRSVLFQIKQLAKHFERLPREREDRARLRQKHPGRMPGPPAARPTRANWPVRRDTWLESERRARSSAKPCAALPQALRRHRRELFRAFGHFAHRAGRRAMNYHITHRTLYEYAAPVTVSQHVARLEPRATATQELREIFAENFPRTGPAQDRGRIISATGFAFSPSRKSISRLEIITAQPGDRARRSSRRPMKPRRPGKQVARLVPRPGFAGGGRAVSICF